MINTILNNKTLLRFIGIAIVVLLVLKQCNQISNLKQDLKNTEMVSDRNFNNYKAAQDTIKIEKNQSGELVSRIRSFEYDVEILKSDKSNLLTKYNQVLKEKTKVENINTLISTELSIKDSIINSQSNIVQDSTSITINFNDEKKWDTYNWRTFNGQLKLIKNESKYSILNSKFNFDQGISLKTSIVNESGRNILRITTPYDRIKFTDIENINLVNDKLNPVLQRPKNWSIGIGVQYGININTDQFVSNGISVGIGVQYSPSWLKF